MGGFVTIGSELSTAIKINPETGKIEIFRTEGLDMGDKRITNLADPTEAGDAVPLRCLNFLGLTDTPSSYEGQGGKLIAVNATEDGLEFVTGGGGEGTTSLWSDTAVNDWPRAEHCVPYDSSSLPLDMVALKWRAGRYGSGVAFHSPSDGLPRAAVGVTEYPPSYLRYTAFGITTPSTTNPQMPAAYLVAHYYGGTYNNNTSHYWLGGGGTGSGKQLLTLDYDASVDKVTLRFGGSTASGGYYFFPQADNTGHIGDDTHRWARVRAVQVVIDTLTQGNFSTAPTTYLEGNIEVLETVSTSTAPYAGTLIRKGSDLVMELLTPDTTTIATNKNSLSLIPGIDISTGEHAVRTDIIRNTEYPEYSGVFMVDRGVYESEAEVAHLCPDFYRFGTWDSSASSYRYVWLDSNIIYPEDDNVWHLGDDSHRWARVRAVEVVTGDLKLKSEKAEWTITEGEDGIYAINNNTGKKYRLKMEEVE